MHVINFDQLDSKSFSWDDEADCETEANEVLNSSRRKCQSDCGRQKLQSRKVKLQYEIDLIL